MAWALVELLPVSILYVTLLEDELKFLVFSDEYECKRWLNFTALIAFQKKIKFLEESIF